MDQTVDVLVIGAGAAGACAAAAAVNAGARVLLLRDGASATSMSSGAIDVAAGDSDSDEAAADPLDSGSPYAVALETLATRALNHPYAKIGPSGRAQLGAALELLSDLARDMNLVGSTREGHNLVLPTALGTVKRTALAPLSLASGDLCELAGSNVGVAHFATTTDYDGRSAAATLRFTTTLAQPERRFLVYAVDLGFFRRARDVHLSTLELARQLDHDKAADALAESVLAGQRTGGHLDHLLLPALLGFERAAAIRFRLEALIGLRVSELCMLPPSPPGIRLAQALERGLARLGVELVRGRAVGARCDNGRVHEVQFRPAGETELANVGAKAVVLATGHLATRGMVADGPVHEPVFRLPLCIDGESADGWNARELLGASFASAQPLLRIGVQTDEALRPLDSDRRRVVGRNLFVAGALLEGNDAPRHRAGLGLCALTGLIAGRNAATASR